MIFTTRPATMCWLPGRRITLSLWAGLIASSVLGCWPAPASAQIRGDPELLKLVAAQYRANLEAILTWQGEAEITQKLVGKIDGQPWDLTAVQKVTFAYDRGAKKYMFLVNQVQEKGIKQGQPIKEPALMVWGGIRTPDGFYWVPEWFVNAKPGQLKRPGLQLGPPSSESPGDFSPHFDPFWYMKLYGDDMYERLMPFYDRAASENMSHVTVSRANNVVTVVLHKPEVTTNRYVFDLDQGANPVAGGGEDPIVTEHHSRTFEKVKNIWVPKTATSKSTNLKRGRVNERQVTWIKNIVNEPVPADTFSPEQVGIRQGSHVNDLRTGANYRYDVSTGLKDPAANRRFWSGVAVVALVVVAASIVLGGWWLIRRRQKKGLQHGSAT